MRSTKLIIFFAAVLLCGCHKAEMFEDDAFGNFDALWTAIDEHYCYFAEKNLDWEAIGRQYRAQITPEMTSSELFDLCGHMVNELQDGHVNLSSSWNSTYYRKWWSEYPQNFDLRCLEQYYLDFDWQTTSGLIYKHLSDGNSSDVGYLRYPSFSNAISDLSLDYALLSFIDCRALIIDIRDNGGGSLTNVETLVSRFIDSEITAGYILHKTGPGHDEFSEPFEFRYKPANRVQWLRPVILLTNRSCFSAANNFAAIMKTLPNVLIVGAKTGGGGGLPFSAELPNGWLIRFSASPILDPNGESVEHGVNPTTGLEVNCLSTDLAAGHDAILDKALQIAFNLPPLEEKAK